MTEDEEFEDLERRLNSKPKAEQPKLSDYEPDGMHHNKPQQRPQNCGTGYCSCIECPYEQPANKPWVGLVWGELPEDGHNHDFLRGAAWAEAKLREKNT